MTHTLMMTEDAIKATRQRRKKGEQPKHLSEIMTESLHSRPEKKGDSEVTEKPAPAGKWANKTQLFISGVKIIRSRKRTAAVSEKSIDRRSRATELYIVAPAYMLKSHSAVHQDADKGASVVLGVDTLCIGVVCPCVWVIWSL